MKRLLLVLILSSFFASSTIFSQSGTFTDKRDGKIYKTITIGTQTWMAENLAWKAPDEFRAFDDDDANLKIYGYLYTWQVAKSACPTGWHLPSAAEAGKLSEFLGGDNDAGNKLKTTTLWEEPASKATNSSGFSALPSGYYRFDARFNNLGSMAIYWLSTEVDSEKALYKLLTNNENGFYTETGSKAYYYSVRCIKD